MDRDDQLTAEQIAAEIHRIQHALPDVAPGGRGRRRDFDCPSIYEPDTFARAQAHPPG